MWNVTICSPPSARPRVPLTPFLCECQSLAGRWLFKPCQIRRMMMSNMPATLETHLTVTRPGCTGSYVSLLFPSSLSLPLWPAPQPQQHILHKVRSCMAAADAIVFFSPPSMFAHKTPAFCFAHACVFFLQPFFFFSSTLLNDQPRIRGPSGVTFFIVQRHNQ